MPNEVNSEVIRRLRSAEGHLHGVIKMVEAGQPCDEILHQLDAVRAALRTAGFVICKVQLDHSANIIRGSKCVEERKSEITRMANMYHLLIKNQ
jgi:hypothetical protein NreA